jgi:hypothetical protein
MKHLRKFNESNSEESKEEILENFIRITDKFGEPRIFSSNFGDSVKWTIVWSIPDLKPSLLQPATDLIQKLKTITEDADDIISASSRLGDWDFNMMIGSELVIEMTPKETGSDTFEFIKEYDSRTLYVFANEVERFFKSRGVIVAKFDVNTSYNEFNETNDLDIFLNIPNSPARIEFQTLFNNELESKADEIDREYRVYVSTGRVCIEPQEEKSYVSLFFDEN